MSDKKIKLTIKNEIKNSLMLGILKNLNKTILVFFDF